VALVLVIPSQVAYWPGDGGKSGAVSAIACVPDLSSWLSTPTTPAGKLNFRHTSTSW